jgi:hypothetical protein
MTEEKKAPAAVNADEMRKQFMAKRTVRKNDIRPANRAELEARARLLNETSMRLAKSLEESMKKLYMQ